MPTKEAIRAIILYKSAVTPNDEVVDGVSERGGFPVVQKKMRQWCLRVSAYAQRLLDGLDTVDWTDSLKETQRNWIGRSEGLIRILTGLQAMHPENGTVNMARYSLMQAAL